MAAASPIGVQDIAGVLFDRFDRAQQDGRIQIALQCDTASDARSGGTDINGPVQSHRVAA
jgi:hypothetical protein